MASALATKLLAEAKIRKQFKILPGTDPSRKIELMYRNELLRLTNKLVEATSIAEIPSGLFPVKDVVPDDQLQATLQRIEQLKHEFDILSIPISRKVVNSASDIHKNIFMRQMRQHLGIDIKKLIERENLSPVLQRSIETNVDLVRNMQQKYLNQVKAAVEQAQINGSKVSLASDLEKIKGMTVNRAKLIARDQAAKFNADLSEARQTNLGIEEYIWTTSGDERVRETHAANDGKTFRWDSPPEATGHPGHDVQCRCIARPVVKRSA